MKNRKLLTFTSFLLAFFVIAWSSGQVSAESLNFIKPGAAVSGGKIEVSQGIETTSIDKPVNPLVPPPVATTVPGPQKKPILTKSGKKAALMKAAAEILQTSDRLSPTGPSFQAPASATDPTKVPHYYGPFPNWANSPLTLPDVAVEIAGDGTGATAEATVGANGVVTGITITNPGSGYSAATVNITGGGAGATAAATVSTTGIVSAISVDVAGSGYTTPQVTLSGGGATTDATATIYGGVDLVTLTGPGTGGYKFPTVDFDMPDGADGVKALAHAVLNANGDITEIIVDQPGSGYSFAPKVVIRDGTIYDPILDGGSGATATATLELQTVEVNTFGAGYTSTPSVSIADLTGSGAGALATAFTDIGSVTDINLIGGGSDYITTGGIKKFQDELPMLCDPSIAGDCAAVETNLGQYIPLAVPDTSTFSIANGFTMDADYYVIALVQHREQMSSSLPAEGTLLREYVQLETPANASTWSKHIPLQTQLLDGTSVPTLMPDGSQAYAVDNPHFLGPLIVANKDRPVRITFYNLLPKGSDGDLFMPKDSTIMGSGYGPQAGLTEPLDEGTVMDLIRNPECSDYPSNIDCFQDNRATLHLHGGITPWISDGTPHQWITPANENTPWPEGVSVGKVPDMKNVAGVPDCSGARDGCSTFYYTNQQSARLMFYHDHAWGITRLNVISGQAAGYLITDPTDKKLVTDGIIPADQIPLVIQDRTFVPDDNQLAWQDPTWDKTRWGGKGNVWYHHTYMPAQNPGDPTGMSAFGRWMYGPWFWPPATPKYGPIDNPYYDPLCDLNDPTTWDAHGYNTDPFCEPEKIPGTPNISVGMEQFNDTPIVNGTAYPTLSIEPKPYRFRILNAANDRFFNLHLYVADPTTGTESEVALNPAELAAAQIDPNFFPTPDTSVSLPGPDWIQIGNEGGFLPAPNVIPPQPITWIIDPTVFNVGNVDQHSLMLAPAERADVIVDFSQYAGKTLILYNDAPAAFPARVASYDYYTGAPDLSPVGVPSILPGYGPNTRTVMQIKVAAGPGAPFDLAKLNAAFRHHADGSGVFESGQHPIIVGQAEYNSAYGTNFVSSSNCNDGSNKEICDGHLRINNQGNTLFGFNTLLNPTKKLELNIEPKAIHDEMNAAAFDEFGRMTANIGLEATPATPNGQNIILYPYTNPPTEMIDATNLPKNGISMTPITPIAGMTLPDGTKVTDGTQIWKITHNGVDTHPLHWHLYDVQVLNRVTWDNIVSSPDPSELGWKDTLRVSPLEDTIVALRPIIPYLPFDIPNSIRPLHPMMPIGSTYGFNNVDANGNPTNPIINRLVNFGLEYVWHCHILSHEEMDMMRPVTVGLPPKAPSGLFGWKTTTSKTGGKTVASLVWYDNSLNETQFLVQRMEGPGPWVTLKTLTQPLDRINLIRRIGYVDSTYNVGGDYKYRVLAENTVGYGGEFMGLTVRSISNVFGAPAGTTTLISATPPTIPGGSVNLTWSYTPDGDQQGFVIQRALNSTFTNSPTSFFTPGNTTNYVDNTVISTHNYFYRIRAYNLLGPGIFSNTMSVTIP